ncbi:hypothetical protein ACOQFB_04025 [Anaeromyxobacter sp. Red801]|uniref:hypothetical protein n=1 Tax=Anaeromyxobacter sp. Red801 TaxID=3411632 RepID=UPI003B9F9BFC
MRRRARTAALALATAAVAAAVPDRAAAHHGVAAVGLAGPEGPGAALETTSALPLPERSLLVLARGEWVPYQRFAWARPENKDHSAFGTLAIGYGITPWLTAYAFQPLSVKEQDGVGRNAGAGDPSLMLALGLKWDDGLRLVPERESLDDLADWHFSAWASSTLPLGTTGARDDRGARLEPDMQTGFGEPSPVAGVAALKQLGDDLTFLADASRQWFLTHRYEAGRYRFGAETRVNAALVWRALARPGLRLDLSGELNGLDLRRDREEGEGGAMVPLRASGGRVLYAGAGVRVFVGRLSAALGVRRAAATALDERPEQQGSEGLERFRATLALSWLVGG